MSSIALYSPIQSCMMPGYLEQISYDLADIPFYKRVVIKVTPETFSCTTDFSINSILSFVSSFFSLFFSDSYKQENRETIDFFYETFGRIRVNRISERYSLHLQEKRVFGLDLTKQDVEILFAAMGDVRKQDLQTIFYDLQIADGNYIHLSEEQTAAARERFEGKTFSRLNYEDLDELYKIASPFKRLETMFMHEDPTAYKDYGIRWYGLSNIKRTIYKLEQMRRTSGVTEVEEIVRLSKKIFGSYTPAGLVIRTQDGFHYVHQRIKGGGCTKYLMKAMNKIDGVKNRIFYLGTQGPQNDWASIFDDIRPDLGVFGVKSTYRDTLNYLTDPTLRFIDQSDEKVELIGYSLGGAQVERDATLFMGLVSKITGLCNPGVDEATSSWFQEKVVQLDDQLDIHYIWEVDDGIRLGGAEHLGVNVTDEHAKVKVTLLLSGDEDDIDPLHHILPEGFFSAARRIGESLTGAHTRETTASRFEEDTESQFVIQSFNNEENFLEVTRLLNNANGDYRRWEEMRRDVGDLFGDSLGRSGDFSRFLRQSKDQQRRMQIQGLIT